MTRPPETWGRSTVHTACPLDCPDSCSLAVEVEQGHIVSIDGSHVAPSTNGLICGKVRRFDRRVYGEDRLLYPAILLFCVIGIYATKRRYGGISRDAAAGAAGSRTTA